MEITYTVKYRAPGQAEWSEIENVSGDAFIDDRPIRFFTTVDGEQIYVPELSEVRFSKERFFAIERKIKQEAGH